MVVISYCLILNPLQMPKLRFDVNITNGVAIDDADYVFSV